MLLRVGVRGVEEIEVLVARERDALQDDERARDQRKVLGHRERKIEEDLVELARDRAELRAPLRHRGAVALRGDLGGDGELPLLEDLRERRQQRGAVDVGREEAQRDGVVDERGHVAAHQVHHRRRQRAAVKLVDLGAEPKVDQDEAAVAVDEQVARVRVAVEEADVEQLREEALDPDGDQPSDHVGRRPRELLAVDPLSGEHLATRRRGVGARHADAPLQSWQQLRRHPLRVRELVLVVELEVRGAREGIQ